MLDKKHMNSRIIMEKMKNFVKDLQDALSFTQQHSDMVSDYNN